MSALAKTVRLLAGCGILAFALPALAEPVLFSCDSAGAIGDVTWTSDFAAAYKDYIRDVQEERTRPRFECLVPLCEEQLNQMYALAGIVGRVASIELDFERAEVARLSASFVDRALRSGISPERRLALESSAYEHACRLRRTRVGWQRAELDHAFLAYPFDSPYLYSTGTRNMEDPESCGKSGVLRQAQVSDLLERSIRLGVDPYLVLAIILMENTPGSTSQLRLDPIANLAVLGCGGQRISEQESKSLNANHVLNSYGTFYRYRPARLPANALSAALEAAASTHSGLTRGDGLVCLSIKNPFGSAYAFRADAPPQALDGYCCRSWGLTVQESRSAHPLAMVEGSAISNTLTAQFIKDLMSSSLARLEDRIQAYNGRTSFFAPPHVSVWRTGINLREHPIYGYQAVDFMLNSLIGNSQIRQMVTQAEYRAGRKARSELCAGRPAGAHAVSDDHYMLKVRNTPRFEGLRQKRWQSMGPTTRLAVLREMMAARGQSFHDSLVSTCGQTCARLEGTPLARAALVAISPDYFQTALDRYLAEDYDSRDTVGEASGRDWDRVQPHEVRLLGECARKARRASRGELR